MHSNDIAWLSLAVIMFHEFEEIAFIEPFLNHSEGDPQASQLPFNSLRGISTAATTLMIGLNFVLFTLATLLSVLFGWYSFLWGFLAVFTVHLVMHCMEWIQYRRYTPSTITAYATLPWFVYALWRMAAYGHIRPFIALVSFIIMLVVMSIELPFLHTLEPGIDRWIQRTFSTPKSKK